MEPQPDQKNLRIGSFAAHSARGLLRDRRLRRKTMVAALAVALLLMVCGSSFLQSILDPHEHPVWFILYWFACAWVTVLALLLGIFDLLLTRRDGRAQRQNLQRHFSAATDIRARSERKPEE
jgi:protein-S-isoprenylcysteine O-methyltransferase Ste14